VLSRKLILSFIAVFVLSSLCFVVSVEADSLMWSQTYGGTDSRESASSLVATSDGGYAIAGPTESVGDVREGAYRVLLVKTDSSGNMEWNRTCGKFYSTFLDITAVQGCSCSLVATSDGGYAIAGETISVGGYGSWLIKTDASGNVEWNRTYAGGGDHSLAVASDGGYALARSKYPMTEADDFLLTKTDEFGDVEWTRTYGGTTNDVVYSLVVASDGGYALAGYTNSFGAGSYDSWLVKTDAYGNMEWNRTYGGPYWDGATSLVATSDGGYAIAGDTHSFGAGGRDFWLVKTDASGNMEWNRTYGVTDIDCSCSLVATSDGGYAIAGCRDAFTPVSDFWLVKTDASGNMEWNRTYGGTKYERARSLVATSDGGYAIAGDTTSFGAGSYDFWLVKTDEYGVVPEYSSWLLTSILLVATSVIVIYKKKFFDDHP
jgi:predicted secreted protein